VRTTSANVAPARASASPAMSNARRAWAYAPPGTGRPSGPMPVVPATNTNGPARTARE
jgi:hypothetical protein